MAVAGVIARKKAIAFSNIVESIEGIARRFAVPFSVPGSGEGIPREVREVRKMEYVAAWLGAFSDSVLNEEEALKTKFFKPIKNADTGELVSVMDVSAERVPDKKPTGFKRIKKAPAKRIGRPPKVK